MTTTTGEQKEGPVRLRPLTERQAEALTVLRELFEAGEYPPSQEEYAQALGKSVTTARWYLTALLDKGWIRVAPGRARAIVIVDAA